MFKQKQNQPKPKKKERKKKRGGGEWKKEKNTEFIGKIPLANLPFWCPSTLEIGSMSSKLVWTATVLDMS